MDKAELIKLGDLIEMARDNEVDLGYVLEHVAWSLDTLAGYESPRGQRCLDDDGNLI